MHSLISVNEFQNTFIGTILIRSNVIFLFLHIFHNFDFMIFIIFRVYMHDSADLLADSLGMHNSQD